MSNRFLEIDDVVIDSNIFTTKFTCDLGKCKGACCTMKSDFGAPLTQSEVIEIEKIIDVVKGYLSGNSIAEIEKIGFWEKKEDQLMTTSLNKRDCVFVIYEGDIAKCAIEKAFFDGKVNFRKPISCHLFPIRVNNFGGAVLKFEEYGECKPALEKGEKTNLSVLEFCKDALERYMGKKLFNKLKQTVE